jgi:hypothetical protein
VPSPYLRDIRYDPEALQAIQDAEEWWARTEDAVALIEFAIARDPTEGKALTESGALRLLTVWGASSVGIPTVTYLYEVDPRYITVKEARFADAKNEAVPKIR